jgi:8-oxo-dGTP pyrophosphatase MutT (NUDIX family)
MHRNRLKNLLERYAPVDKDEIVYKEQILTFIDEHKDCFERTLQVGHITASCWLVSDDNSRALLTHHKKLNKWIQLGGHCDGESDVLAVALKEAQEESGISSIEPVSIEIFDIAVHINPAHKNEPEHYHYDIRFLLKVVGNQDFVVSDESHNLMWIDKDKSNLPTSSRGMVRMFEKWLSI